MTLNGWLQIALLFALVLVAAAPLGALMARVYAGERTVLTPLIGPLELGLYRLAGVDPAREQGWLAYTLSMLAFNAAGFVLLYGILRLQGLLPLNPLGYAAVPADLAFNTAVSFVTNTNWQSYAGEATMSLFSQMAGLTVQNFLSAATGLALAVALVRGFARSKSSGVGNFFVDVTRSTLYVLLPLSLVTALALVALGTPQTLGSKTYTNGTFDAADSTFSAVSGASVEALVIYIDTGSAATSPLVAYIDTGVTGLPVTPNGGDIAVAWNASGIFAL